MTKKLYGLLTQR